MTPQTTYDAWPALSYSALRETGATLQLWTQIVGKIRLSRAPWENHSWQVALYVTARGLTSSPIPDGQQVFQIDLDFIDQVLRIQTSGGGQAQLALRAQPIAEFYSGVMGALAGVGIHASINQKPNEMPDPIRFGEDRAPRVYEPAVAQQFWLALVQVDRVFKAFRTRFVGKCSPVHFFWGAADLAVTRFSGRRAPLHKGGVPHLPDAVTREAYSHEVSSAGFWPGGGGIEYPAFYSYAYPEPPGFREAPIQPEGALYNATLGEFILPYEAVRRAPDPDAALLAFLQSTYEAAATAGGWDRAALDCPPGIPSVPRPLVSAARR